MGKRRSRRFVLDRHARSDIAIAKYTRSGRESEKAVAKYTRSGRDPTQIRKEGVESSSPM